MIYGVTPMVLHGKTPKLELDRAPFKAGWGRVAGWVNGEVVDALNRPDMTSPAGPWTTS